MPKRKTSCTRGPQTSGREETSQAAEPGTPSTVYDHHDGNPVRKKNRGRLNEQLVLHHVRAEEENRYPTWSAVIRPRGRRSQAMSTNCHACPQRVGGDGRHGAGGTGRHMIE